MPGDTTYAFYGDSLKTKEYVIIHNDTIWITEAGEQSGRYGFPVNDITKEEQTDTTGTNGVLAIVVMFAVVLLLVRFFGGVEVPEEEHLVTPKMRRKRATDKASENGHIYDGWLSKYNPYYNSLSPELKERFLLRTIEFAQAKEFRFHAMVEEDYMLILLSGAAIQLTFGLQNYLLEYFPVIHVIRKEYTLHIDQETYYGHVSRNGIYISWTHFMEGYSDYTDAVNVGLHEMAHAISYDVFLGMQDRHDRSFKERLRYFQQEGKPVFRALKKGDSHILDEYAATNFDEFWAVSIEHFFENPVEFRDTEPGVYQAICDLLNQDPTRPEKIIDKKLAGIRT